MRPILTAGCLCVILGCSSGETDAQRQARAKAHVKEGLDSASRTFERKREAAKAERAKAKADEQVAAAKAALKEAVDFEGRFVEPTPAVTEHYRAVVFDYPDTPEAKTAQARIDELKRSKKSTIE